MAELTRADADLLCVALCFDQATECFGLLRGLVYLILAVAVSHG